MIGQLELVRRIEIALRRGGDYLTLDDLVGLARAGKCQFWAADGAAVASEILTYPRKKILNCFMAAGELPAIFALQDRITDFAREQGCAAMVCHGRTAWGTIGAPHGWQAQAIHYARELRP